jgi:hypothetical protein
MKIKARNRRSVSLLLALESQHHQHHIMHARQAKIRVEKHLDFSAWKKKTATSQHDQEKKGICCTARVRISYRWDKVTEAMTIMTMVGGMMLIVTRSSESAVSRRDGIAYVSL